MVLHFFLIGWLAGVWWPGIEVDAPRPGGGDPWWWGIVIGAVSGAAAVGLQSVSPVSIETIAGVAVTLGAGAVGGTIARAGLRAGRK